MPVHLGRSGCSRLAALCAFVVPAVFGDVLQPLRLVCSGSAGAHRDGRSTSPLSRLSSAFFQNEEAIQINGMYCSFSTSSQWLLE